MERENFKLLKEYLEAAIVEKRRALSDELHTFLSMQGDIFSSEVRTKEAKF